ncbi:MAG: hypothetical protein ACOX6V_00815 [Patescibacteria group bacterium]
MKIVLTLFLSLFLLLVSWTELKASRFTKPAPRITQQCLYGSTQARVQPNIHTHWQPEITIREGETFRVGSFHNHTGTFAHDTIMWVVGPRGQSDTVNNESVIRADTSGTYVLHVQTTHQTGTGCEAQAVVHAVETKPITRTIFITTPVAKAREVVSTATKERVVFRIRSIRDSVVNTWNRGRSYVSFNIFDDDPKSGVASWEEYRKRQEQLRENEQRMYAKKRERVRTVDDDPTFSAGDWEEYRRKQEELRRREQERFTKTRVIRDETDEVPFSADNWAKYRTKQDQLRRQEQQKFAP